MTKQLFDHTLVDNDQDAMDFLENILESSTEYSIIGKDLQGTIVLWNEGARRLYGYEPEEVIGKANSAILHVPEEIATGRPREILDRAARDGKWEGTIQRVRKNGQRFSARVLITPRRGTNGQPVGFLLISRDVSGEMEMAQAEEKYRGLLESAPDSREALARACGVSHVLTKPAEPEVMRHAAELELEVGERRRAQEALRESEEHFRSAFEDTNLAMVLTDLEHRFVRVNAAFARMFGYSQAEMLKMSMGDITHPDDLAESYALRKALLGGEAHYFQLEKRYLHKDGHFLWGLANVSLVRDARGQPNLYVGQVQDITERKRAEEANTKYLKRLRFLHQIDRALIAGEGPAAIAAAALVPLRVLLGVPRAIVNLFDLANGEVEWLAAAGRRRVHVGPGVRYSIRLMGDVEALKKGEPQLIDVHALPPSPEVDALLASGVDTYLVVPMIAEGELIGALSFGGAAVPFSNEQVSIAQEAATQFAIALTQARLHESVKRHAQELEVQVTERKQAEEALRASEGKNRLILDTANDAFIAMDAAGRITEWNKQAESAFGWSRAEAIGRELVHTIIPARYHQAHERGLQKYLATGEGPILNKRIEIEAVYRDGREFPVELVVWPIRVEGICTFSAFVRDTTDRKLAEVAIRERETQIRLLLDSAAEGIYGLDLNGNCTFCNSACARMLGYAEPQDFLGRNMHALKHHTRPDGTPYPQAECQIYQALRQGEGSHVDDEVFWRADGKSFPVEYWAHPIRQEGRTVGAVVTFLDITERRLLEGQFRQAQKMEAVGRLAGGVAHDFNNLLTVIMGYSELLQSQLQPGDPLRSFAEQIRKSGAQAETLTRQLLAFSRQQVLQPQVMHLNAVVTEMEKMLRRVLGEDIELVTALDPQLRRVKVDPGQIGQVLMNLAVNARDAMPQHGKLTIETRNTTLDETYAREHAEVQPGPYVLLAMSDTGCGMDEATKARIFEPFFTTKEAGKGTGLGLATVFGIVKQSNGHINVYSEVGRGTTFKIYLPPAEPGAEAVTRPSAERGPVRGTETVLVAEDNEALRVLMDETLRQRGYQVLAAQNGGEALLLCERHEGPIHLLVSDVVMPHMSGRELAERLAALRPTMKVLYVSGYTDDAVVRHGVLSAAAHFLQKPFSLDALALKVREVLDKQT